MRSEAWPKISLFPLALAGLVIVAALAINVVGGPSDAEGARIAEASQLATRARDAYSRGNWTEAREYAGQAVALNPSHTSARLILGLAYLNLGSLDEAEAEFRHVLAVVRYDREAEAWAHNNLGVVFQHRGQFKLASEEYLLALSIDPFNEQARLNVDQIQSQLR